MPPLSLRDVMIVTVGYVFGCVFGNVFGWIIRGKVDAARRDTARQD